MNVYVDNWEIFVINDESGLSYAKVFCFIKGYWRINSGITKIEKQEDTYLIHGVSGSCYFCRVDAYGIPTKQKRGLYEQIINDGRGKFLKDQKWEDFTILLPH